MPDFSKLVELVKQPPNILFGFVLVSGAILYGPMWLTEPAGLSNLPTAWRIIIGGCFFVSAGFLISHWTTEGIAFARARWKHRSQLQSLHWRLQNLTREEKALLRPYIAQQTRTQYFDFTDGVVAGLEFDHVIARPAPGGIAVGRMESWAYNIQPWAWTYLNQHSDLLSE